VNVSYRAMVSRRTTLKWIGAFAAYAVMPRGPARAARVAAFERTASGYGTDPKLIDLVVPWERTMTERELVLAAVFADMILPATATAPAASAIGVPDYVDEWVSAPYPLQQADRTPLLGILGWLDDEAQRLWQRGFAEAADNERRQILDDIVASRGVAGDWRPVFFRLRFLVVGAYYTTQAGFDDIGYVGNVALDHYPAPSEAEIAILEAELKKLGL
jgi:Gluconate 2-dehydrogenase subunit 3